MSEDVTGVAGELSRRRFLGSTAAAIGAVGAVQLATPRELAAVPVPRTWDRETDVVVVGTGYAGLAAAIEAHDAGSRVVVVEKAGFVGGNSTIASGGYNAVDPERQKKQGIEDSVDLHVKHTLAGGDYRADPAKVRFLVEHALEGITWLESLGVQFEPTVYTIVGSLYPRSHDPINNGRGGAIVKTLKAQVDRRGIPILLEHTLTGLVRERAADAPVLGVQLQAAGATFAVRARKGVVLATGGFSADVAMRSKYDPRLGADVPTTNVPTATGEAILAAEDEGADVIGMSYIQLLIACNYFTKKYGSLANLGIDSAIFVNLEGKRFVAEDQRRDVMAEALLQQSKKVLLWVADDRCKKRFTMEALDRFLKQGLIFKADTLEGLAAILKEKFGTAPDAFLATVRAYNDAARQGVDAEFGKQRTNLKTVEQGPFWASPTQAGVHHTMGGLRTHGTTGQVLDRRGRLIPRLFAAGEVTGGVHGTNRLGGNATADCIVFGRAAGKEVSAQPAA
jgi:flavocytochrome c